MADKPTYRFNRDDHIHQISYNASVWQTLYGTTTVINEVYPPPLAWYGAAKALELLGFIPPNKEPDEHKRRVAAEGGLQNLDELLSGDLRLDEYISFLSKCYKNHDEYKKSQGKKGTNKHALIEKYIKGCIKTNGGKPRKGGPDEIKSFIAEAFRDVEKFLWSEAHCFSEKLWTGGITDFGFVHKNGAIILGDAKPSVYPKHFIQTGGYSLQIAENGLVDSSGKEIMAPFTVEGFCIFDYNKGKLSYLGGPWVEKLKADFAHTVEMFKRKDLKGDTTL